MRKLNVLIAGSTGYIGVQLVKLLSNHQNINIKYLCGNSSIGKNISFFDKTLNNKKLPKIVKFNKTYLKNVDIIFTALPNGEAQEISKHLLVNNRLIDLAADFRLEDPKEYKKWYKINHKAVKNISNSIYAIPEISKKYLKNYKIISCPGCYPTSILLPLLPLLKKNLISCKNIIIDSKSGYSGAGKKFNLTNIRQKKDLNFYNYNTNNHRHICEIYQELNKFSNSNVKFSFNPHVLPIFRGLMSTIYCDLKKGSKKDEIINALKKEYSDKVFIDILNHNIKADFFSVCNTNKCLIKLFEHNSDDKIIIVSLIDNLLKGASGQAIQCMNLMFGLEDQIGLV